MDAKEAPQRELDQRTKQKADIRLAPRDRATQTVIEQEAGIVVVSNSVFLD